jgi:hypothetical protein
MRFMVCSFVAQLLVEVLGWFLVAISYETADMHY